MGQNHPLEEAGAQEHGQQNGKYDNDYVKRNEKIISGNNADDVENEEWEERCVHLTLQNEVFTVS